MKATPQQRYDRVIAPLANFARTPAARAAILDTMNRIAPNDNGKPWRRQEIDVWLHPDPARRHEPRLGAGLALIEAVERVIEASRKAARTEALKNL